MARDYYDILGVPRTSSKDEIKKAYKQLAKKYHPDLNKEAGSEEKFKEINEAAAVLGDDKKREQYDHLGHDAYHQHAKSRGSSPGDFDYRQYGAGADDDFFENIFDMFTGGGRPRTVRGDDLRYDLEITLEDAAFGAAKKINLRKHEACEACKGKGGKDPKQCTVCHGRGMIQQAKRTPFGVFQSTMPCRQCGGVGQEIKHVCSTCDGDGVVIKSKSIEVKIPAGVDEGTRVRVPGEGNAGPRGTQAGDLYLFIHVEPHDLFERRGDDIHLDAPIGFGMAVFGGEIEVPTLDGKVKLKIPANTQTHTVFRLRDKGVQHLQHSGRGDEYVRVILKTPDKLTKHQSEMLRAFVEDSDENAKLQKGLFGKLKEKFK
jgi:molecular chaperone DnaJ